MNDKIESTDTAWDDRTLGADEEFVKVVKRQDVQDVISTTLEVSSNNTKEKQ